MGFFKKWMQHPKFWLGIIILVATLLVAMVTVLRVWYSDNLRPVSDDTTIVYFTVESGESNHEIATKLDRQELIRSSEAFETYLRSSENQILQAGTYKLSQSMSVQEIVQKMVDGEVAKNLLTILPGKRLDQIKNAFAKAGYSKDETKSAFDRANYIDHPALASLPKGATLEGYLYPDSFQQQTNTPASTIVRESLNEMQKYLTFEVTSGFAKQGLNTYKAITLASIVLQETDDPSYQPMVARVFLNRLNQDIALESDATYVYVADKSGIPRNAEIDSPYNTYKHRGLPPGPISNVTQSALKAVANPAKGDYLYFVAGDNGNVYFSKTLDEHEANVRKYCRKQCSF
jgi:UPF0755 protein